LNKLDNKDAHGALASDVPGRGEVALWFVSLQEPSSTIEAAASILSPEEMQRADRFRFSLHRNRFVLVHAALRHNLCIYSACPASSIDFTISPHGKPSLVNRNKGEVGEIEFNLSHSEDLAVVAVSFGSVLGVDVEQVREMPDWPQMARQFFSDAEIAAIERVPSHEASTMFLRFWTRKEALLKAMGTGLQDDLSSFCTAADDLDQGSVVRLPELPGVFELLGKGECGWDFALRSFEFEGFVGALAVSGPVSSVWRLQWVWQEEVNVSNSKVLFLDSDRAKT
jgi:4'-phosphopantetheinyl transferase